MNHNPTSYAAHSAPAAQADDGPTEVEHLTLELQNQRELTQHWKAQARYVSTDEAHAQQDAVPRERECTFCTWVGTPESCQPGLRCRYCNSDTKPSAATGKAAAANAGGLPFDLSKITRWTFDGGMTAEVAADGQWVHYSDLAWRCQPPTTSAAADNAGGLTAEWRADIDNIADELEAEALNYEGDFADTVKGCAEALYLIAARAEGNTSAADAKDAELLTNEQIDALGRKYAGMGGIEDYRSFARDIENAAIAASQKGGA